VSNFERTYITEALIKHCGNIAMAARASNKHRRAFWALMRKHDIAAEPYRLDDGEE
jgi:DNA-binding NtrC family response regulator